MKASMFSRNTQPQSSCTYTNAAAVSTQKATMGNLFNSSSLFLRYNPTKDYLYSKNYLDHHNQLNLT
jgi:hypothetical protein